MTSQTLGNICSGKGLVSAEDDVPNFSKSTTGKEMTKWHTHTHIEGILPKGPYLPCLRMADRALLAGYPQYMKINCEMCKYKNTTHHEKKIIANVIQSKVKYQTKIKWFSMQLTCNWHNLQDRRWTPTNLRSINPNMINHFIKQSPLLFIHAVCKWIYRGSTRDCQIDVSHLCWLSLVVDTTWFGRLSNMPIDIENLSRLSKHTLSIS